MARCFFIMMCIATALLFTTSCNENISILPTDYPAPDADASQSSKPVKPVESSSPSSSPPSLLSPSPSLSFIQPTPSPDASLELQTPSPVPFPFTELSSPKIVVKKSERLLELWDGDILCGSYSIGLGWEPIGHKQVEGDGRTPEGIYYLCMRNSQSNYYLSLGISYPNKEDAEAALEAGTIDTNTYDQIADAIGRKTRPPWNTAMGGQIMIHGMGGDRDWTAGCIAVDNYVMDILWEHCPNEIPVIIEP